MPHPKSLLKLTGIIFAALIVAACPTTRAGGTRAVTPTPTATATPATPMVSSPRLPLLRLWPDCSTSTDDAIFAKNVDSLIAAIGKHKLQISGVEVVCFAAGDRSVWSETPDQFVWGDAPESTEFQPNFDQAPPNAKVFQDAKDRWIRDQKLAFDRQQATLMSDYEQRSNNALAELKKRLLTRSTRPAICTSFFEFARRMQRENRPLNLPMTDGFADCSNESIANVPELDFPGRIVVLQIPTHDHSGGHSPALENREAFLKALFPTARIFPVYMAQEAVDELLK